MNRRNFLKSFSVAVAAIPILRNFDWPTVTTKAIEQAKVEIEPLLKWVEIPIDRFSTMRITRLQYQMRAESFKKKMYVFDGNRLTYNPTGYQKGWFDYDYSNI